MQRKFLQEKSLNRSLDNAEKSLNVDLSAKSKLIPYSSAADMLGLNDLYIEERDACENYRMIFTVAPICTNVIYNAVTEPVFKEGSEDVINLVETPVRRDNHDVFEIEPINESAVSVDQKFAIRDTEFSHPKIGNFKYHCGYDIFNNHLLRTKEFEHVKLEGSKKGEGENKNKKEFNTIFDFAIDYSGRSVTRIIGEWKGPLSNVLAENAANYRDEIRMYQLDDIKTMNAAFYDEMRLVDGWYGFYNTGYINIPNAQVGNEEISINKILNNEIPCGFIDMYPERDLYSFIPKVNRFRKRLERNWDCTIMYPYESDVDLFNKINKNTAEAIRIISTKVVYNNVGDELLEFHTLLRHTLAPGDTVRLFYRDANEEEKVNSMEWDEYIAQDLDAIKIDRYSLPVTVVSVGDSDGNDEKHYFTVKVFDVMRFCRVCEIEEEEKIRKIAAKKTNNDEDEPIELFFFFKKIEDGCDDKYYFRKFKKIKNSNYVEYFPENNEDTSMFFPVTKLPDICNEDSLPIKFNGSYFLPYNNELSCTQNKIAFGQNIYGDRIAQVIFNDDICISGLKDNLGRPLSSVYFTAVKTNRGHKEWYEECNLSAETVEYSHCFGEVTSGLDLPYDDEATEYNVRKLHNVFVENCEDGFEEGLAKIMEEAPIGNYSGTPTPIESGITLSDRDVFYGDIVEFSRAQFLETPIEKVYHRFNTAQRELLTNVKKDVNKKYYNINYDELVGDLYDTDPGDN